MVIFKILHFLSDENTIDFCIFYSAIDVQFFFSGCKYSEFRLTYGINLVYRTPKVFSKVQLY